MIDHETARRSFATSLDFPLEATEREALDAHLAGCPSCRAFAASVRADAAVIRDLEIRPVPAAVRANVAIAAEHGRGSNPFGRWVGIAVFAMLLLAVIGAGTLGVGGRGGGLTGQGNQGGHDKGKPAIAAPSGDPQVVWKTEVVALVAQDFSIDVGGKTFRAIVPGVQVSSDPGTATYRTLEATWRENGAEMRVNMYFGGDAGAWWVDEIRIYDGKTPGEWLTTRGTFFKSPVGTTWNGDQDVSFADPSGQPAVLHLGGASIATQPFDGVKEPPGGGVLLPENARPFAAGGALHCSGILQLNPKQAEATLLKLGFRLSWRLMTTTGPNTGYSDIRSDAPDGIIFEEPIGGSDGELIVFVAPAGDPKAVALPYPADCPRADPNITPPPPAS